MSLSFFKKCEDTEVYGCKQKNGIKETEMASRRFDSAQAGEAERAAARLLTGRVHIYDRIGYDRRPLAFLADGSVGLGAGGREQVWDVRGEGGQLVLEIASQDEVTCRLRQDEAGTWRGEWLHGEKMAIAVFATTFPIAEVFGWDEHALEQDLTPAQNFERVQALCPLLTYAAYQDRAKGAGLHTLLDKARLMQLVALLLYSIPLEGDTIEFGVYRGGVSGIIAQLVAGWGKQHFLCDSFAGLPAPGEHDNHHQAGEFGDTAADTIHSGIAALGLEAAAQVVTGWFADTLPSLSEKTFCFAHIDTDYYESTLECLEFVYPRLSAGGWIVLDDYTWRNCEGVKKAVDAFFADKPECVIVVAAHVAVVQRAADCPPAGQSQREHLWKASIEGGRGAEEPQVGRASRRFDSAQADEAERAAARLLTGRVHIYDRIGYDRRPLAFLADGSVGLGAGGREQVWDVRGEDGGLVLEIASHDEVTCRLRQDEAGTWRGEWLHDEGMPIAVYPSVQSILPPSIQAGNLRTQTAFCKEGEAIKVGIDGHFVRPYEARVFTEDVGHFASVTNSNVLIYFRHGFGDWVHLSCILPLLDPSNRYWITRFGDDYTSVLEGSDYVTPIYLGSNSIHCGDGTAFHNANLGIDADGGDGSLQTLSLPLSLHASCRAHRIDTVLTLTYPEVYGWADVPFHTKARYQLPFLLEKSRVNFERLGRPLPTAINFAHNPALVNWVRARLMNCTGFGYRKLCLISRSGYTCTGKNWGHRWREDMPTGYQREGEECRDFMRLLLRKDPHWMFLIMEDDLCEGEDTVRSEALHAYSYAELFGTGGAGALPFGQMIKALVNLADLAIGVPTGPFHLSMVKQELPTIGLWLEHFPSWYDEPKAASVHILGRNVRDEGIDQRPGSITDARDLHFETVRVDTRIITGQQVLDVAEKLLY